MTVQTSLTLTSAAFATDAEIRHLFAYLRTVTPSAVMDAHRRIRQRFGDDPIHVDHVTVKRLAGRRLESIDVVLLIWLSA